MDRYRRALYTYIAEMHTTQMEIGKLLGVSDVTIGRWLSGVNNIPPKYHEQISKLTGFEMDEKHCPLEEMCPVWNGETVDHRTAAIFDIIAGLDKKQRIKVLRFINNLPTE